MSKPTKKQKLLDLKTETLRLLAKIEECEADLNNEWPSPRLWAAVKRASLDLNVVGVKIRKFD